MCAAYRRTVDCAEIDKLLAFGAAASYYRKGIISVILYGKGPVSRET